MLMYDSMRAWLTGPARTALPPQNMRQDHFFTLRLTHSVRRLALALGLSLPFAAPPSQAQDLIPWRSAWKYADDGVNRYTQTPPYYHPDYN